jgi:2-amino-4-hydroxy-6-hydroxymethyldihydropteridine diphosphokinase
VTSAARAPAYVGLGSNLDGPRRQLERALEAMASLPRTRLVAVSGFYLNPPLGPPGQPDYLNAVAGLLTRLEPEALLAALQEIEVAQGRLREGVRWGPRTLDLDLLLHGTARRDSAKLTLPHPGLRERAFVIVPLAEIAPGLRLPDGTLVARLAQAVDAAELHRVAA